VQIALYGNASAIIAVDRSGGEVFAATLDEGGNDGYYSHVIVHHDSPLRDFNDLLQSPARYSFANGDPNSTSGYLVPGYYAWALNKIDVRRHFTKVVAGNHEANALAVAGRQVDVATCNSESLRRLQGTLPAQHASLRVIWTSPLIPLNPAVWRTDLSPAVKEKVRAFMTDYGVERSGKPAERLTHERSTLETMKAGGFRPSSNKQLIPLRQIALYRDRVNAENDDRLSAAEKTAKLREIDAKLSQLDRDIGS
jgi:phosphonate transport system substrate-binding protein